MHTGQYRMSEEPATAAGGEGLPGGRHRNPKLPNEVGINKTITW